MRAAVVPVAFAVAFAIDATALNPGWGYSLLLYPTAIFLAALSFGMVGARAGASLGGPDRPKPGSLSEASFPCGKMPTRICRSFRTPPANMRACHHPDIRASESRVFRGFENF
jgi:hypothetical protein